MANSIGLYNFTKKQNSTACPNPDTATWVTFTYKNETSVHNPVLLISWGNEPTFTYAQIADKFYYITDIVFVRNNLYEIHCKLDALATRRPAIMNSTQLVLRTSTDCDPQLIDSEYITKMSPVYTKTNVEIPYYYSGTYVVGVADGKGISYYGMSTTEFERLTQELFAQSQDSLWDSIASLAGTLNRTFLHVLDYIRSCHWVPFNISSATKETVTFGYWPTGITASKLSPTWTYNPFSVQGTTISTPDLVTGNFFWTNSSPFRKMILHLPYAGEIMLDPLEFTTVNVAMTIDMFGKIGYTVTGQSGKYYTLFGDCGVPVALSASSVSPSGLLGGIAAAAGGGAAMIASGGGVAGLLAATAGTAGGISAVSNAISEPTTIGTTGSFSAPLNDPYITLFTTRYNIIDDMSSKIGYLLMKQKKLSTVGYYKCSDVVVDFGDYQENQEIANYMEGGFYIE